MAPKLTSRQHAQLGWLETLPPKFERATKIIELMATHHADESQVRGLGRLLDETKAQAAGLGIPSLSDTFGYMATLLRRGGGQQIKVRGLREMLAGAKINWEGARRAASTPDPATGANGDEEPPVSP